jgi:ribonuclease Z
MTPSMIVLGTGGPRPDIHRAGPAILIRLGDQCILVDAGRGVTVQLAKAGVRASAIRTLFITHHHFDHIGDIYDLALSSWLDGRREPLRIFGPPDTKRIVDVLLNQVYDKDIQWRSSGEPVFGGWSPVVAEDIVAGEVYHGDGWQILAEPVKHGHGLDLPEAFLRRWICYGYRFEAAGRMIAISGDTVDCDGLRRLAAGADVLVMCCYLAAAEITSDHFRRLANHTLACGDTVGRIAARAGVKTLVLTHHRPRQVDAMLGLLRKEVREDFSGSLVIASDLEEVELPL